MGKKEDQWLVAISKNLSYILRHGASAEGIPIRNDGYVLVSDLLNWKDLRDVTVEQIREVVETNSKKRFELLDEPSGKLMIRAVQGHSLAVEGLDMEEITDASEFPVVVHGTYLEVLPLIRQNGLSKMARNHIHFATALPSSKPISGMRGSAEVVIHVNLDKALADGIKFYRSSNGVILSSGIDGILPPTYFKRISSQSGQELKFYEYTQFNGFLCPFRLLQHSRQLSANSRQCDVLSGPSHLLRAQQLEPSLRQKWQMKRYALRKMQAP